MGAKKPPLDRLSCNLVAPFKLGKSLNEMGHPNYSHVRLPEGMIKIT